jgi:general stress protein YciG
MAGKQGFASMSEERRKEIAAAGGRAAQAKGACHRWTSESASSAGRKGGTSRQRRLKEQKGNALPDVSPEGI